MAEATRDRMFAADAAAKMLGMRVTAIGPGSATVTMPVRPELLNGFGICQGGLITTLADTAFAYACNAFGEVTVASGFDVELLAPGRGGSLTILATALVETNSRMDDAIFEEFKGTGNMELRLDRKLSERRIYPAIDVDASSTRHEELLFDRKQLQMVWKLRRVLSGLAADGNAAPGLELLVDRLRTFRTNDEFLNEIGKQPAM